MDGARFIRSVTLQNILSYGPDTPSFPLEPLNVFIGPNASGKSNFLEALSILEAAPKDIQVPFQKGGGVQEWLWKGNPLTGSTIIEATVQPHGVPIPLLRYRLSFTADHQARFSVKDEVLEDTNPITLDSKPVFLYQFRSGDPLIKFTGENSSKLSLRREEMKFDQSILSQWLGSLFSFELSILALTFNQMRFYREFPLGRDAPARLPQQTDLPQGFLAEDASNLAVVLSFLQNDPQMKKWIHHQLKQFYPSVLDIRPRVLGGTVQVFFEEAGLNANIPATRISDGSLRFLCLLAALNGPEKPSVICIEEPEMGMHPDAIPQLAKLLVEASKRSQIIVTTHSDILVDALTDTPEAVVICEKVDGATQLRRLNGDDLKAWLENYRLGELWTRGHIGGNLW